MSSLEHPSVSTEQGLVEERQIGELQRHNATLHEEIRRLQWENAEVKRHLAEAETGSRVDRATRRAALNLMEDAVEARRAEQRENHERRRVEDELRQADQRKDQFLATLAHELRTPLAPVRNSLHILRLSRGDMAVAERLHEMMERQVNHMVRLVDDLMEVSRITRGRIELRKEPVELAAVVRSAVETSRPLIDAARHQLAISLPTEPLLLDADPVRLSQVLNNLLNNSAKYTDEGGQIWLTARRESAEVLISVKDTGAGIPADMVPKIFDLFMQVDRTYDRAQGGLGIGLTLVRSLVEMHGGSVEAHSDGPGHGSEFTVRLPVLPSKSKQRHSIETNPPVTLARHRMLVVDDNRDSAESLRVLLKCLGAEVWTANSGPAALEVMHTCNPTVMLLDIGMPGMDGNELARRVRQFPEGAQIVLVALTGWGQDEDRRRSKEAGFDHHLVKPIDLNILQGAPDGIAVDQSSILMQTEPRPKPRKGDDRGHQQRDARHQQRDAPRLSSPTMEEVAH